MTGFLIRWALAFFLLAVTFNPTPFNYVTWLLTGGIANIPVAALLGLLLVTGYIIYFRASLRSIGGFGMGLVAALIVALAWVLYDMGLLSLNNPTLNLWLGLLAGSLVMGIGLSWSIIRRRISGQYDVDDPDT
ncbi:MAG: DUF6524 family protein [Pseudomonadota bacterium]